MDIFYEQFITKDYGEIQRKFQSVRHTLIILAVLSWVFVGYFGVIVFLFGYFMLGIVARNLFLEYEYEITENELVITKIMNRSKRKIIKTIDLKKIISVDTLEEASNKNIKIINACIENMELKEKVLVINENSKKIGFKLTMDKKLISMCSRVNPNCFNKF